jgi:nucleoside-diphosphate kinase
LSSGKIVVMVLEGEDAIGHWRDMMGATDPAKAAPGTLRQQYGSNIEQNAVHGSDSEGSAAFEISYFFSGLELS